MVNEKVTARQSFIKQAGLAAVICAMWMTSGKIVNAATTGAELPAGAKSEASQQLSTLDQIKQKIDLEYLGWFIGPSLGNFDAKIPTEYGLHGEEQANILWDHNVYLYYVLNPKVKVGFQVDFQNDMVSQHDTALNATILRTNFSNLVSVGKFTLGGNMRLYMPINQSDSSSFVAKGKGFGFRVNPQAAYQLTDRWTLTAEAYMRVWEYRFRGPGIGQDNIDYYFAPGANYKINDRLSFTALYEMNGGHALGEKFLDMHVTDPTDLQLGVAWDITPNINLNPYIQFFPGGKFVNLDSMSVGAYLFVSIL